VNEPFSSLVINQIFGDFNSHLIYAAVYYRVFFGNITDVIENYIFPNLVIKFAENESELSRTLRYSINKRGVKRQTSSKQLQAIQIKEYLIMSNLFTAVSVEQQEILSGGGDTNISNVAITTVKGLGNITAVEQTIKSIIKKTKTYQSYPYSWR
jgi:hypothetical protein